MDNDNSKACDGLQDRRAYMRYLIRGVVSFQWEAADGTCHQASGMTRDVSKDGAFIECASPPPVASPLKLLITLSTGSSDFGPVLLRGVGDVRHLQLGVLPARGYGACAVLHLDAPMSAGLTQETQ